MEESKTEVLPDIPDEVPVTEYMRYWMPAWAYDLCKWLSCLGVPAFGTFYALMADALGLPCADQVGTACLAVSTLLGTLIGASEVSKTKVQL